MLAVLAAEADCSPLPEELLALCYADMRRLARKIMAGDGVARILQPTELANEAAIKLLRSNLADVTEKGHLLALAARTMRQVLIDEARKSMAQKRQAVSMMTMLPMAQASKLVDIEALDRALIALGHYSEDHVEIVELRFSLGLSLAEIVDLTGVSLRTVTRRWQAARAWLFDYLNAAEIA